MTSSLNPISSLTEAKNTHSSSSNCNAPIISYQVAMPQPSSHLFEINLLIQGWQAPVLDLKMPVWTPGSYLVREYSKHLQNFSATTGADGRALVVRKVSKNHWQVGTSGVTEVAVQYRIFANELSVRTNHLDITHAYFNPAALFLYLPGYERTPIGVTIVLPRSDWRVTTPLLLKAGEAGELVLPSRISESSQEQKSFFSPDFDTLVDSPFEIGSHQLYEFEVLGKQHQLAIWGKGNLKPELIIQDIEKIIRVEAEIFGCLPYDRYVFILHLTSGSSGGLEHKNACSLHYPRFGFRAKDKYHRFMQLVAHEFLHLWNVKRIRPKALEVFDYDQENYTTSLWFSEGTTSYYDLVIPKRAGIYDSRTFLDALSNEITRFQKTPGRLVQPVSESSFDTWIKLYRPDANSGNSQISYYLKGELVSLLLDLLIRARHGNKRSLDDVMLKMWQQFGQPEIGFTPEQLRSTIESVAEMDLSDFFNRYIDGTEELPFNEYLEPFGLRLVGVEDDEPVPYLGVNVKTENGRESIKFVECGSPAQLAGVDSGDELLAIDGIRVTSEQVWEILKNYHAGDIINITLFHQDELRTLPVTLAASVPNHYQIGPVPNSTNAQKQNFTGWLEKYYERSRPVLQSAWT